MKRKAFTLIELLVVIAIIAILAAILFPVFAQARDAAKNTALLSQMKQTGTSNLIYTGDNDDNFPLAYQVNVSTGAEVFWQDAIQPYSKNWDIMLNNKRPRPTGATAQVNFKRTNHLCMPGRAITNGSVAGAVTNGFFQTTFTGFAPIRYTGIAGASFDGGPTGWYNIQRASSLSTSAIQSPSQAVMIVESSNSDCWFTVAPAVPNGVFGSFIRWQPSIWNENPGDGYGYAVTATTKPVSPTTTGLAPVAGPYTVPNGRSTYVATDSSARANDTRRNLVIGDVSTVNPAFRTPSGFNPEGNL